MLAGVALTSCQNTSLRVLVYNADADPGINSFVTQDLYFDYFTKQNIKEISHWKPWTLDGKIRVGGYVTQFEGDFTYLTVRGSGHMVPGNILCWIFHG